MLFHAEEVCLYSLPTSSDGRPGIQVGHHRSGRLRGVWLITPTVRSHGTAKPVGGEV